MRLVFQIFLSALFILTHPFLSGQINPIDDCSGAPALPVNTTCVANNYTLPASFANNGMIQASCSVGVGQNQEDGWYTFVATGTSTTIELTGNYAHTLAVFSGCPPTVGNEMGCNIVTAGNTATVTIATTPGVTYYIQVHRKSGGNGQTMTGTICVYSPVAATNDDPCSATVLTVGASCSYTNSTNAGATSSAGVPAPGCANYSGGDVWFQVTVPASGNLIIDSNTGVVTDGGMALYSGTCGSLSLITCNDDGSVNGLMPMISQPGLTPGSTVWIRFWEYGNNNNGTFQICAYDGGGGALTNDDPCSATTIAVGANCSFSTYTNVGATNTAGAPAPTCASYSGGDVWFQVTVPPSGNLVFDSNTGTMFDGGMAIYSGTCGSLTQIACDDDASTNGAMPYINNGSLTPGSTIWIRFWEYGGGSGTFQLCVYEGVPVTPPGGNVVCGGMTPICSDTPIAFTASTGGTAASVANPLNNYGCLFTSPNPTWYYLQIQAGGNIVIDMGAGSDIDFALWGPFANLTTAQSNCTTGYGAPIDCSYSISATEQANVSGAVAGQVYVLLVTNYADVAQVIDLNSGPGNTALTDCSIVLPIELLNIYATTEYSTNTIHWLTLSENQNDFFIIEKSLDGTTFSEIGKVDGNGNSAASVQYEFVDRNVFENLCYYRLKQVDMDGVETYSKIISVERDAMSVRIFPNPTSGVFTVNFPSNQTGNFTIVIKNAMGVTFEESIEISSEVNSYQADFLTKMPSGIYFIEIYGSLGNVICVQKVIKTD